jgi:hypothetical protein
MDRMRKSDRFATKLASILSLVVTLWGLAFVASPIGAVGGAGAAVLGLLLGSLALRGHVSGRWRTAALAGIAAGSLALLVFVIIVILVVFFPDVG